MGHFDSFQIHGKVNFFLSDCVDEILKPLFYSCESFPLAGKEIFCSAGAFIKSECLVISKLRFRIVFPRHANARFPYFSLKVRLVSRSSSFPVSREILSACASVETELTALRLKGHTRWHSSHPKISGVREMMAFSSSVRGDFFCVR